ncbi:MAG: hypothetical protein C4527_15485 [Candidatus Omnitrophota bacterium]|jgi:hypothetical protein|nr:MAG: hypothetical protein C4527_15485 [Candidatus Omnitrophota bacterium]
MFKFLKRTGVLTKEQRNAEMEAVRLLTEAQHLLMKDGHNVDEAVRLRDRVIHEVLPPQRMYIVGKHPKSLLRDVERRIFHAYYHRDHPQELDAEHTFDLPKLARVKIVHNPRFIKASQRVERESYFSTLWMILIVLSMMMLFVAVQHYFQSNEFANAFRWLSR